MTFLLPPGIKRLNTHRIFSLSYSHPETNISLAASSWSWLDSIIVFSLSFQAHKNAHFPLPLRLYLLSFKYLKLTIGLRKLSIYMTAVFIQLHSRVIDFPMLSFLLLNENLPQYLWFMVSKKLRKASISWIELKIFLSAIPACRYHAPVFWFPLQRD